MSLINNAKWTAISQFGRVGMQFFGVIVLSRMLAPGDFGAMAIAMVVINLANLLRDMGTSAAIIQRRDIDDETVGAVFTLNIMIGVALAVVTWLSSTLIASTFHLPELRNMLAVLAFVFPIAASASVFQSLLERESKFKVLARIEIISSTCGLFVAIALARHGVGVLCLPAQALISGIASAIQLWCARPQKISSRLNIKGIKAIISFSGNLTLFNLINYLARNADSVIIGRLLGSAPLGIYSQAYKIMLFPVQNMTAVATRALFPVISRFQDSPQQAFDIYVRLLTLIIGITAPLMGGVWILRAEFVQLVLGDRWTTVVPVLAWLVPVGFIQSIVSTTGTVFMCFGRTKTLMRLGVIATFLQVSAFVIGATFDVVKVAELYFVANLINSIVAMHFTMRQFGTGLRQLLKHIGWPMAITAVVLLLTYSLHDYLLTVFSDVHVLLAITITFEIAAYASLRYRWISTALLALRNSPAKVEG